MFTGKERLLNIFYSIFDDSVNFSPSPRIPHVPGRERPSSWSPGEPAPAKWPLQEAAGCVG